MSRTIRPDGSIRFAPDRGHRVTATRLHLTNAVAALATVLPVGAISFVRLGPVLAVPLVIGTAIITLIGVAAWRWTLPRLFTVTVSKSDIVLRNYGRTRSIRVNQNTMGTNRRLASNFDLQSDYLIISGDGEPFRLNTDMWSEADLTALTGSMPRQGSVAVAVTPKQLETEFPGLLPRSILHPYRYSFLFVMIALVVVLMVMFIVQAISTSDDKGDATQAVPSSEPVDTSELPDGAAATQNRLQAEVQRLLGGDEDWTSRALDNRTCPDIGGYQRVVLWTNDNPRATYTQADSDAVVAAARRADLDQQGVRESEREPSELTFTNDSTGAELDVTFEDRLVTVQTASACSVLE